MKAEKLTSRLYVLRAMVLLCCARLLIEWVPFERWRSSLGLIDEANSELRADEALRIAGHVQRAAGLLPISTYCLPRAMALSWMLRSRAIRHSAIIAVRPANERDSEDRLHAWVEVDGVTILGNLPGRWIEMVRLGC